jgi:choline dehydrogenase-like flavoprotein
MVIAIQTGPWPPGIEGDEEAVTRLQEILLQLAEGARGDELDSEYKELRKAFLENAEYSDVAPRLVRIHRDLGGMWPYMKSFDAQWEPRRKHVREELEPLFRRVEELTARSIDAAPPWPGTSGPGGTDPADWTGMATRAQKLATARALLPVARASIERLIEQLSRPTHNGGPPLDETENAIENLRELHAALGQILEAIEGGRWSELEGQGLPAEAAKYAKRAARALRDDPIPYAMSALLLAIFSACGFPAIASHLAAVALTVQKGRSASG